jgi:DNA segregation ATPase FtsK/SpoIIIE, S-DNA-T family
MVASPVPRFGAWIALAVVTLVAIVLGLVAALVAVAVWVCAKHPFCAAAGVLSAGTAVVLGLPGLVGMWAMVVGGALALRAHRRTSFDRWVLRRWRRTFVYAWRWRRAVAACDLNRAGRHGLRAAPRLGTVWSTRWTDTIYVHPLEGQDAATFAARANELARAFGVLSCSATWDRAGMVRLNLRRGDPLTRPVPMLPIPNRPDLAALRVGIREDGGPWTLSLVDGHTIVVGQPGSGTRSVVWSLVRALAVPVSEGRIELWGADGTGGIGLGPGTEMFTRLALRGPDAGARLLEAALARLRNRSRRQWGRVGGEPPPVVLVLHELVRWGPLVDENLGRRLMVALDLLLDYGQPTGVVVLAVAPMADAQLTGRFHQQVTLGGPVGPAGDPPEVGIVITSGEAPVRVRVARMDDAAVSAMAAVFPAPANGPDQPARNAQYPMALEA